MPMGGKRLLTFLLRVSVGSSDFGQSEDPMAGGQSIFDLAEA